MPTHTHTHTHTHRHTDTQTHRHTHTHTQSWTKNKYIYTVMAKNVGTLDKYYQRRLLQFICIVNPFYLLFTEKKVLFKNTIL